jgi:phenylacetate-CoA ligase
MDVAYELYRRTPVSVQNMLCSYYGWREKRSRYGKTFDRLLEWLEGTQFWSEADIKAYQDENVAKLVRYAYDNVPYYRAVMTDRKLRPSDIQGVVDLPKLPVLTKQNVRENFERLKTTGPDRKSLITSHTGGTTGTALSFCVAPQSFPFRWAVWWRHRARFGMRPGMPHVNFTGKRAVPNEQTKPPYWRYNAPFRQTVVSMHHITPEKVPYIAEHVSSLDVPFFSGYPSVIHSFALMCLDQGIALQHRPRFVFTGAENVMANQRAGIYAFTGASITDQYGFSEACGNASQCSELAYHEDFEFGLLENCGPLIQGGGTGGILATGFTSYGFPFIRYAVGDTGTWASADYRCACGRASRVLSRIEGRADDVVITPEGQRIMRFDYLFKGTANVAEAQVLQEALGALKLRIVKRPGYSVKDENELRRLVSEWISPKLEVEFEYLREIPRAANGKFRAVISTIASQRASSREHIDQL